MINHTSTQDSPTDAFSKKQAFLRIHIINFIGIPSTVKLIRILITRNMYVL